MPIPDSVRAQRVQDARRGTGENLTTAQYEAHVLKRHGKCDVCGIVPSRGLHVDYDHEREKLRGLLCAACHEGVQAFGGREALLRAAYVYARNGTPPLPEPAPVAKRKTPAKKRKTPVASKKKWATAPAWLTVTPD